MAPRRDSPSSSSRHDRGTGRHDRGTAREPQVKRRSWLRLPPLPSRRGLALAGSGVVGLVAAGWLLGLVWPLKDRSAPSRQEITAATLA
ncbi:MAG: hypothetical protein ACKOZW_07460, partial [Cyanobium sp.]